MNGRSGMRTRLIAYLLLAWAACPGGGSCLRAQAAAVETYSIDASHSSVVFSISHFYSRVTGRFTGIKGTISLDPDDLGTGSARVVIDAGSIDTDVADRDTHLRSADFFDVQRYPRITFESSGVRPAGENRAMLDGILTLKGVSRPVTLEIEFLGSGPDLWGGYRGGFEARTTINRKDFGMTWNETLDGGGFILGDEVSIVINIEGLRQEAPEPKNDTSPEEPRAEDAEEDPGAAESAQQ